LARPVRDSRSQVLAVAGSQQAYCWGTHGGAELDLLLVHGRRRYGVEFTWADAPVMIRSLHVAIEDLRLDRAWVVCPGTVRYAVHEKVEALPLTEVPEALASL